MKRDSKDDQFRGITAILIVVAVPVAVIVLAALYAIWRRAAWMP